LPVDARLAAGVHASLSRKRNSFGLTLPADIGFELREYGQHAEEGASR